MKVLYYHAIEDDTSRSILEKLVSVIPWEKIETCGSLQALENLLCRQEIRLALAVIIVHTGEELTQLIGKKSLLDDIRIILITPDAKRETVQKGHKLYPRFMADKNIDMDHLAAIIRKSLFNIDKMSTVNGN